MIERNKKVYNALNYCKHFLVLVFAVSGCVSISAFASLVSVSVGMAHSAVGSKICVIIAGIKRYKSIVKEKERSTIIKCF